MMIHLTLAMAQGLQKLIKCLLKIVGVEMKWKSLFSFLCYASILRVYVV